jgi:hypothetical protein
MLCETVVSGVIDCVWVYVEDLLFKSCILETVEILLEVKYITSCTWQYLVFLLKNRITIRNGCSDL